MVEFWIDGQPTRKSNRRQLFLVGGKPLLAKSPEALRWLQGALLQVPAEYRDLQLGSLDSPVAVTCFCFYRTRLPDLSVEMILDMLQKAGVIKDDRYVYRTLAHKLFDSERPGAYIIVKYLDPAEPEEEWRRVQDAQD